MFDVCSKDKIGKNRGSVQIVKLFYFIFLKISVRFIYILISRVLSPCIIARRSIGIQFNTLGIRIDISSLCLNVFL